MESAGGCSEERTQWRVSVAVARRGPTRQWIVSVAVARRGPNGECQWL